MSWLKNAESIRASKTALGSLGQPWAALGSLGQRYARAVEASSHELGAAVGVMDIAGAMEQVEKLSHLWDGAKQRALAASAFSFLVVAGRSSFGV
jgi:hypothetical protein